MYTIRILYLMMISVFDGYTYNGSTCPLNNVGELRCRNISSFYTERIWFDIKLECNYHMYPKWEENLPTKCHMPLLCWVPYKKHPHYSQHKMYKYLNLTFLCKDCLPIYKSHTTTTNCRTSIDIQIDEKLYDDSHCPDHRYPQNHIASYKSICENSFTCSISDMKTANISFNCKGGYIISSKDIPMEGRGANTIAGDDTTKDYNGGNNTPDDDISTESNGGNNTPDEDISTESKGISKYVSIAGGIVGVLLFICFLVRFLLRRRYQPRNAQKPSKENVMAKLNTTYDPTNGQTESENNQQAHLMNSPDAKHMSASHAVNMVISTDESNTYSHLRSTVDDSDVMYDHTVRNAVHDTCDGDYGITHRRITEDDYDVSGNYRQLLTNKADPVYN